MGHVVTTLLAEICGKLLASRISERTMGFLGGGLFLIFALETLHLIHNGHHFGFNTAK